MHFLGGLSPVSKYSGQPSGTYLAGFPHVEPTPLDISMDKDLMEYMNTEKIKPETYFRSKATCNTKACAWLEENYPAIYGANYGE